MDKKESAQQFQPNPGRLFRSIFTTQEDEITCPLCRDLLDVYVDREISGEDAAKLLPYVHQHLDCCNQCVELYEGLRDIVNSEKRR
jgi:hypothetical protein